MKKKPILLVVLLIGIGLKVSAQNHWVGITGGVNRTNITAANFFGSSGHQYGFMAGTSYEYSTKKGLLLGGELLYQQRGFADRFEAPPGVNQTSRYDYYYLAVPLQLGFTDQRSETAFFFGKAGLMPALLLGAQASLPGLDAAGNPAGPEKVDIGERVATFDLAGLVEAGGRFRIGERMRASASFVFWHSLSSMTSAAYFPGEGMRHRGLALQLGLQWRL